MTIKVMVVDDHTVVRKGLIYFLETVEGLTVVGEAENGKEAMDKVKALQPDVVLMDLLMPVMDGIEATEKMLKQFPKIKVLVLSSFSEHDHVIPALQAGASGYQLKDIKPEQLAETIRAVYRGESKLHDKVTKYVLTRISNEASEEEKLVNSLTKREKEVLIEIAKGKSNKEIAADLEITEKTVKTHISNVFSKIEVHDRTQAALFAIKFKIAHF
ncbi:LuxR family transcriptional regulator [Alkalihalobacillus alcalophilus ATCC 27647 = CGMCC 1.3604]|uniref:LuxR family transcriptional regulator n=1 Tax=Alkalihalobacillus alcalophilus ATCC 27647 = CGMCC 1.3604 TaxID=1218173 RepID=A0A094WRZ8_ALKAL|nr:response regulator transcription factor [Alkalihalobacillus alcalophilus]KGA98803.1 LuxR family transcriptional regulator [Alkalihalobacillus alcalophilus ATCC 27647 = CGMCC 1.3604]MED1560986.1 response regulator transcription factor [Alkalihalobacillus alcalophilus]THG88643.1 LuxR family transcriptional regulator [Alkalihalobacillus alcalophilus ATCC 27647 = CGMCC 1.3604]